MYTTQKQRERGDGGREREGERERLTETERQTDRQRATEKDRERQTHTHTQIHTCIYIQKHNCTHTHTHRYNHVLKKTLQGTSFQTFAVSALLTGHFECGMARGTGCAWCGSVQLCILPQRTLHTHLGVGQIVALRAAHCINKEQRV